MGGGYQSGAASQVDWRGQVVVSAKTTTGTAIRTNRATNQPNNQLYTQIKYSPASWTFIKVHLNSFIWQKLCGIVKFVSTTFCHGFWSCVLCVSFWSLTPEYAHDCLNKAKGQHNTIKVTFCINRCD